VFTALENLDRDLSRLAERPENQYRNLFDFQRLTRIVLALRFYSQIAPQPSENGLLDAGLQARALECSKVAAPVVLGQILRILSSTENESFEQNIHPPSRLHEQLLGLLGRGPADLGRWDYFFGLLDCASRLCSITDPGLYPAGFDARLRSITARSGEARLRWKAVSSPSQQ
jgi:hypothetical protein